MFLSHTGPRSSPACPNWVAGKVKRENVSTRFIPRGNSHPSSCHRAVTSCHFQSYVALGTWLHQGSSGQMHFQKHCKAPCLCLSPRFLEESFCGERGSVGVSVVADILPVPSHPSPNQQGHGYVIPLFLLILHSEIVSECRMSARSSRAIPVCIS